MKVFLYHLTECVCVYSVSQSCLTLCNPMEYSWPGSSVHGIFQARILEQIAISYSRGSSWPRGWTHFSCVSCTGRQIFYRCATWEAPHLAIVVSFNFYLFYFLAAPHGMWDLSSLNRNPTCARCRKYRVLTAGPPGKSQLSLFKLMFFKCGLSIRYGLQTVFSPCLHSCLVIFCLRSFSSTLGSCFTLHVSS